METRSIPRRTFVSLAVLGVLPFEAQAVDPVTCLQAAGALVGIVAGISGMKSDAELRKQMNAINARLDAIIANQEVILSEIRALRFYIDAAFETSWRSAYSREIQSFDDELNDLAAEPKLDDRVRGEYRMLRVAANRTANQIGQMDIAAFPSFSVGVAVTLYCMVIERLPRQRYKETCGTFAEKLDRWLDPKNPRSVPTLISHTETEIQRRIAELDARPRTTVIGQRRVSAGIRCSEMQTDFATANGDFAKGFTVAYHQTRSDRECIDPPDVCRRHCIVWDEPATNKLLFLGAPNIPVFSPTGNDFVDSFNRERIAIYELMFVRDQQKLLSSSMTEMKATLLGV